MVCLKTISFPLLLCFKNARALTTGSTTSILAPSITPPPDSSECWDFCLKYDVTTIFSWSQLSYNITITAATKVVVVDEATNDTLTTSMVFNDLPKGYTLPSVNEAGTPTKEISYTDVDGAVSTTVLTWPTEFLQHPTEYFWNGQLMTTNEDKQSLCVTATDYVSVPYPSYSTTQPRVTTPDSEDGDGLDYVLHTTTFDSSPKATRNPDDPFLQSCIYMIPHAGYQPVILSTARYLTVTSTSRTKGVAPATPLAAPVPVDNGLGVKDDKPPAAATNPAQAPSAVQTRSELEPKAIPMATGAPTLVVGGEKYTAVTTFGTSGLIYNVAGQTLRVGSTVTIGSGSAAQTIALKTNARGALVVESASAGKTQASTLELAPSAGSVGTKQIHDGHGTGADSIMTGSRTSTAKVALQTVNAATSLYSGSVWSLTAAVVLAVMGC